MIFALSICFKEFWLQEQHGSDFCVHRTLEEASNAFRYVLHGLLNIDQLLQLNDLIPIKLGIVWHRSQTTGFTIIRTYSLLVIIWLLSTFSLICSFFLSLSLSFFSFRRHITTAPDMQQTQSKIKLINVQLFCISKYNKTIFAANVILAIPFTVYSCIQPSRPPLYIQYQTIRYSFHFWTAIERVWHIKLLCGIFTAVRSNAGKATILTVEGLLTAGKIEGMTFISLMILQ